MPNYTMLAWNASREAGAANLIFRLNYAASASLTINCRKTKILSWTRNVNGLVQAGGEQIEAVDKFTYLGSEIGGTDLDIESRIKKARSAFDFYLLSGHWSKTECFIFRNPIFSISVRDGQSNVICCLDRAPFGKLLHFVQNLHSIFIQNLNLKIASSWINEEWL